MWMNHKNQHKPCRNYHCVLLLMIISHKSLPLLAPEDELRELLTFYFTLGLNDKKIVEECLKHYDGDNFGLRPASPDIFSFDAKLTGLHV